MRRAPDFLISHFSARDQPGPSRPHITVTWAQSLDAKISGPGGARVILSGPESMEMTHWLRSMHDSILIGINTLILDDPRLQIQLLPQDDDTLFPPQPLILDPNLRFPLSSRMLAEWTSFTDRKGKGSKVVRQPWVICGDSVSRERREQVERAGARVVPTALDAEGRVPPVNLPRILQDLGLRSVMVEGGSRILSSFLRAPPRGDGSPLVDSVIVTVAPMFVGKGVGVVPQEDVKDLPDLKTVYTETMGKDAVMICTIATGCKPS